MTEDNASRNTLFGVPDRISQLYYRHGLFCSSHPISVIFFATVVVIISCHPLLTFPFPGNEPQTVVVNFSDQGYDSFNKGDGTKPPAWYSGSPMAFIQQVFVRATVTPWQDNLEIMDGFRAPLGKVFDLQEAILNFQTSQNEPLSQFCLHVGESVQQKDPELLLPRFNCLIISPANFWHQNILDFRLDQNILKTIAKFQKFPKGILSFSEILFGMQLKDTGVKQYPIRARQRTINYAITIVLQNYTSSFIDELRRRMEQYSSSSSNSILEDGQLTLLYYPDERSWLEILPLLSIFLVLFLYMYFSVRKMEMVKSKVGMALSAVATVLASLGMSCGLCSFLKLTPSFSGHQLFPYVVVIIGLENILVLTRSVVSTPTHLDIKIRVAQGISREGWSITKNLLAEVTIFTFGFLTFVPAIQELSLFAVVGLLSDFFLQMWVFTPVLALDIRRVDPASDWPGYRNRTGGHLLGIASHKHGKSAVSMTPGLSSLRIQRYPTSVVAPAFASPIVVKLPRRLRFIYFWARMRLVQRALMVFMVTWFLIIVYKANILPFVELGQHALGSPIIDGVADIHSNEKVSPEYEEMPSPRVGESFPRLSPYHWPTVFEAYNITLAGQYLGVLPPIYIASCISPDEALKLRHPEQDRDTGMFRWESLGKALESLDSGRLIGDGDGSAKADFKNVHPFTLDSPVRPFFMFLLAVPSLIFIVYLLTLLYRCVCSRNYAEWRTSWTRDQHLDDHQVMFESVPVPLKGHDHSIECVASNSYSVVSCCLAGKLMIWNIHLGDSCKLIDRNKKYRQARRSEDLQYLQDPGSDYESGSPEPADHWFQGHYSFSRAKSVYTKLKCRKTYKKRSNFNIGTNFCPNSEQTAPHSGEQIGNNDLRKDAFMYHKSRTREAKNSQIVPCPTVWCLDYQDSLIAVGCSNGVVEFWNSTTGELQCCFEDLTRSGVVSISLADNYVVAARLCGSLEFLVLSKISEDEYPCLYHKGWRGQPEEDFTDGYMMCSRMCTANAHQQPINVLVCEGGRVVTGSQDHTIKVFRLEDGVCLYTLHGHYGPITALFVDKYQSATAGSGSQDGSLCVWDLETGTCVYSIQAHDGCIKALSYSVSYVITLGDDDKICVWERFQGHLLTTIRHSLCNSISMLTDSVLVTSKQGALILWDVSSGEPLRYIALGHSDASITIQNIVVINDTLICDYGNELRILKFPTISTKSD